MTLHWSRLGLVLCTSIFVFAAPAQAIPKNLGNGLDKLVEWHQNGLPTDSEEARLAQGFQDHLAQKDRDGRILVNLYLNGKVPLAQMKTQVAALGLKIVAETTNYRQGVLSAYVSLNVIKELANLPGVRSVTLVPKPRTQVGKTTAQGVVVHKTDQLNLLGFTGQGVTIGVLSDSYTTTTATSGGVLIKAEQDIASGDLPGVGNPLGNTTPVVVIQDSPGGSDEGRGMLQIIHDTAPQAKLCFATAFISEVGFAQNILNLADPTKGCDADVIVDDVIYFTEPMYSDGLIAQAAQQVVDQGVSYFSSAGNSASAEGYESDFRPVSDATVRAGLANENLNLAGVPSTLTAGGFHDFDPGPGMNISQKITVGGIPEIASLSFQWNDPFDVGGITSDYNVLIFRANGNYVGALSGTANNFNTDQAIELLALTGGLRGTAYQLVVTRANTTPTPLANRFRYTVFSQTGGTTIDEFVSYNTRMMFGHNSAAGANGVAAYAYDSDFVGPIFTPAVEGFTSPGPVTIYFDASGNRLANPEIRQKPDFAAVDGLNTTFFPTGALSGTDAEGDGFPNFFGTSAAAPQAAAIAALLLDKANGAITPARMRQYLQGSAPAHDLSPNFSQAVATLGGATVTLTANGDGSNFASSDPNFFTIAFAGTAGQQLTNLTLDLTPSGLAFDPRVSGGFPFTVGSNTGGIGVTAVFPTTTPPNSQLALTLTDLEPGDSLGFGVDRDVAVVGSGGNSADLLTGATFSATVTGLGTLTGTFSNMVAKGYSFLDGFGLVDSPTAFNQVPPFAVRAATWQWAGTGDFTGDGKADILWRNYTTGANEIWVMDGYTYQNTLPLLAVTDTTWHLVGAADFTGDGQSDLIWRNYKTGENALWQMNGNTYVQAVILPTVTDVSWQLVGAAELTGDTNTDLLWRNYGTGDNAVWQMSGVFYVQGLLINPFTDLNWQLTGAADLTGDLKADLVWRNYTTGQNLVWQMNGLTFQSSSFLPAVEDLGWQLVGAGDLTNDAQPDLLWRKASTGEVATWQMNGLIFVNAFLFGNRSAQQ